MSQNFLSNASFHFLLNAIDQELADNVLKNGCFFCNGKLHRADYPRSPLGVLLQFRNHYDSRISFCCVDCRKRTTPMSVRFFGRRWYPAPIFMLMSILSLGINTRRLAQVKKHFGLVVSKVTWKRWRRWWRNSFADTRFWKQARGQLPPTDALTQGPFPRVLLDIFQGKIQEKIILLLRFFSPLTGGSFRAV